MRYLLPMAVLVTLISCDPGRVFEENQDFEEPRWPKGMNPEFTFSIEDTTIAYNILMNVRNGFDYPFYNLYYEYELLDSTGTVIRKEMQEMILFDPKTGEPLGSGLGDLFDHQKPVLENFSFPHSGDFTITFTHFMRSDTLPLILSVGARVEKDKD